MALPSKSLEIHHIVSALMLCGLLTMMQREALLGYVDHHPQTALEIVTQLENEAQAKHREGEWIGAQAARQGLEVTVALQVSDLWRNAMDLKRHALVIKTRAEQAIQAREQQVTQEQAYPRAA